MAIIEFIKEARKRGASSDDILRELENQNPDKADSFKVARERGASSQAILAEIEKQNKPMGGVLGFGLGALKGVGSTLASVPMNIARVVEGVAEAKEGGKAAESRGRLAEVTTAIIKKIRELPEDDLRRESLQRLVDQNMKLLEEGRAEESTRQEELGRLSEKPEFLQAQGTAQKLGFGTEKVAEFLLGARGVAKGAEALGGAAARGATKAVSPLARPAQGFREVKDLNLAGRAIGGVVRGIERGVPATARLAGRSVGAGAGEAAIRTAQTGEVNDETKTAFLVGAAFPVAGKAIDLLRKPFGALGKKIAFTKIKPTQKDIKDGFDIKNVIKHDVAGSLEETVAKTHVKLNQLAQQLKAKLGDASVRGARVNIKDVLKKTEEQLKGKKDILFGENRAVQRSLKQLKDELKIAAGKRKGKVIGSVDLVTATNIKRGAGTKGAWSFGRADPDAKAVEKVYTTFYRNMREAVEKSAPDAVKDINRQISELIPISNAALRRLPVEQRNQVLSLTDNIGLFASVFNPRALALLMTKRALASGKVGNFLIRAADLSRESKTGAGRLIFGR